MSSSRKMGIAFLTSSQMVPEQPVCRFHFEMLLYASWGSLFLDWWWSAYWGVNQNIYSTLFILLFLTSNLIEALLVLSNILNLIIEVEKLSSVSNWISESLFYVKKDDRILSFQGYELPWLEFFHVASFSFGGYHSILQVIWHNHPSTAAFHMLNKWTSNEISNTSICHVSPVS